MRTIHSKEKIKKTLPDELLGDKIRLKQVLINLTKYALKHTQNGEITIRPSFNYDRNTLDVHIVNTGKGISPDKKHKLLSALSDNEQDAREDGEDDNGDL